MANFFFIIKIASHKVNTWIRFHDFFAFFWFISKNINIVKLSVSQSKLYIWQSKMSVWQSKFLSPKWSKKVKKLDVSFVVQDDQTVLTPWNFTHFKTSLLFKVRLNLRSWFFVSFFILSSAFAKPNDFSNYLCVVMLIYYIFEVI